MNAMTFEQNDLFSTFNQDLGSIRGLTQEEIELIAGAWDWGTFGASAVAGGLSTAAAMGTVALLGGPVTSAAGYGAGFIGGAVGGAVAYTVMQVMD